MKCILLYLSKSDERDRFMKDVFCIRSVFSGIKDKEFIVGKEN